MDPVDRAYSIEPSVPFVQREIEPSNTISEGQELDFRINKQSKNIFENDENTVNTAVFQAAKALYTLKQREHILQTRLMLLTTQRATEAMTHQKHTEELAKSILHYQTASQNLIDDRAELVKKVATEMIPTATVTTNKDGTKVNYSF